jgi:hypothetical protein
MSVSSSGRYLFKSVGDDLTNPLDARGPHGKAGKEWSGPGTGRRTEKIKPVFVRIREDPGRGRSRPKNVCFREVRPQGLLAFQQHPLPRWRAMFCLR